MINLDELQHQAVS